MEGPLDFGLIGILAGLTSVLAAAGVSVFAASTYETDYILVKEARLSPALKALAAARYEVAGDGRFSHRGAIIAYAGVDPQDTFNTMLT